LTSVVDGHGKTTQSERHLLHIRPISIS